jgi:hypothetical protein
LTQVHSGDILSGQQDGPLMDLERVYVNLPQVDQRLDTIVFTLNIYSGAADFSNLESAYVRLVNGDTNQELCRIELGGGYMRGNAIVFAKLYRYMGTWQIMGLGMPIVCQGGTWQATVPHILQSGCAYPPPQPLQPIGGMQVAVAVPAAPEGQKVQKPTKLNKTPSLAVASAKGIAAATLVFGGAALTVAALEPGLFTDGVDFGADACMAMADAMPEMDFSSAGDFASDFDWAPAGDFFSGVGDGLGDAAGAAGEWAGGAADSAGDWAGGAADSAGDFAGDAGEWAGGAAADAGDMLEDAADEAGDCFAEIMKAICGDE